MSAYSDNPECSSMAFSWVPPRSFPSPIKDEEHRVNEEVNDEREANPTKVRKKQTSTMTTNHITTKALKPKDPKKRPSVPKKKKGPYALIGIREKKNQDDNLEGVILNLSHVPAPVCTCTGVTHQCYRWGSGGWQSSCTISISEYPLPMSSSRPSYRLAGRKMSIGAYGKLLRRLANEGHDLSYGVDLKDRWARHGTNKFVTIR